MFGHAHPLLKIVPRKCGLDLPSTIQSNEYSNSCSAKVLKNVCSQQKQDKQLCWALPVSVGLMEHSFTSPRERPSLQQGCLWGCSSQETTHLHPSSTTAFDLHLVPKVFVPLHWQDAGPPCMTRGHWSRLKHWFPACFYILGFQAKLPSHYWARDGQQFSILWEQVANLMREIWQDWSIFTISNFQTRFKSELRTG